mgnify:CR=1 FL=1
MGGLILLAGMVVLALSGCASGDRPWDPSAQGYLGTNYGSLEFACPTEPTGPCLRKATIVGGKDVRRALLHVENGDFKLTLEVEGVVGSTIAELTTKVRLAAIEAGVKLTPLAVKALVRALLPSPTGLIGRGMP